MKKYKRVMVEWVDACTHHNWTDNDKAIQEDGTTPVSNVGWLLKRDKKQVILAGGISDDDGSIDRISIPRGCVKKIHILEMKDAAKK